METLAANAGVFGVPLLLLNDVQQSIVHVVGPEQGMTLPGTTIVCGAKHPSTYIAFGALAFRIGTSEVACGQPSVLAQRQPRAMRILTEGIQGQAARSRTSSSRSSGTLV